MKDELVREYVADILYLFEYILCLEYEDRRYKKEDEWFHRI